MSPRTKILVLVAVSSLALAGCGGGDDGVLPVPADPLAAVPDSALQTAAGTVEYQKLLNSMLSETREAIDVTALVLPTSETAEPLAIN